MQKNKPLKLSICLSLMGLTLFSQTVFGQDTMKISNLDNISESYIDKQVQSNPGIIDMYSYEAQGVETTLKLDSMPLITNSDLKINLSLRDADLTQALRMLADKAGVNIIIHPGVEGKLTLDLKDITLNEAFLVIFKSSQLAYRMEGKTITVLNYEESIDLAYQRSNATFLPVKYARAEDVAKFMNTNVFNSKIFGLSNKAIVSANPSTNQIIIFGSPADVNAVKRILPSLDTKPMVNSFVVKHTTPKEMAELICNSLFFEAEEGDGEADEGSDDKIVVGAGSIACMNASNEKIEEEDLASFTAQPLTIAYFSDSGKITTYGGSVEQVETIRQFIKEHDKKQLMAYVELSVVELNEAGSKTFNNTWNLWTPFVSLGFSPDSGFALGGDNPTSPLNWYNSTDGFKRSDSNILTYTLKYIIENHNGRVLTNPKIMVTNGKKSTIDLTSDYIKSVTSQVIEGSTGFTSGTQRQYDIGSDNGLLIEIVPFISPEGYVSMNITPEFATIKEKVMEGELIASTLLQRRDLELKNVRVKDGETLVLAGLIQENETQTVKKMPILSDLPFIGAFFRGNVTEKSREELVILITPHIVKDHEDSNNKVYDL